MKQTLALAILDAGHSVFLTGPAGSGKTHVLSSFIRDARSTGKSVAVTASTGIAATHLGGTTIHAWSGIGIADQLHARMMDDMSKSRREQIEKADVLVIDEVSMLHDFRLDMVDDICRAVRMSEEPFGGLQVVLSGDFYQLPPINRADAKDGSFVTESRAWESMDPVVCYLEDQYRQEEDELLDILSAMRADDLRRRHVDALMSRKHQNMVDDNVTQLYTRNVDVDSVNQARLDAMEGELHEYEMTHTGRKNAVESLTKSCLAPEVLQLKEGALVMFVKNAQDRSFVNGTLGVVVGFDEDTGYPIVRTANGREIDVEPDTWEMRDGERKVASLTQLPLRLAWAITIHKSQGMTLDGAHIDLGNAFVPGMGYVALSRVRSLQSLSLGGLNRMALTLHEQAHELDSVLRKCSAIATARYEHLEEEYKNKKSQREKRQEDNKNSSKEERSRKWQEKLAKMRKEYPNAFQPWVEKDDEKLRQLWKDGVEIKQLTETFGRHPGSVRSRLKKHFGEDLFKK